MDFVNKVTNSVEDKQLCCFVIAKLIPNLEDLSFAEIENMLEFVEDRFKNSQFSQQSLSSDNNTAQ